MMRRDANKQLESTLDSLSVSRRSEQREQLHELYSYICERSEVTGANKLLPICTSNSRADKPLKRAEEPVYERSEDKFINLEPTDTPKDTKNIENWKGE